MPAPCRRVARNPDAPAASPRSPITRPPPSTSLNFADIAARLNPAVVNIDATARGRRARRLIEEGGRRGPATIRSIRAPRGGDAPRRGTGTGFLIDPEGHILTNHHVIEGAERLTVKLADGRSLRADVDRLRSRHRHRADQGRGAGAAAARHPRRFRRSCASASGSARSAIRSPTSTPSPSAWSASSAASCSTRASTTTSRPMPRSASATAAGR